MNDLLFSPYVLESQNGFVKREGAFVKYKWAYSDLFPWPELGEGNLKENIKILSSINSSEDLFSVERSDFPNHLNQTLMFLGKELEAKSRGKALRNELRSVTQIYPQILILIFTGALLTLNSFKNSILGLW